MSRRADLFLRAYAVAILVAFAFAQWGLGQFERRLAAEARTAELEEENKKLRAMNGLGDGDVILDFEGKRIVVAVSGGN